MSKEICFICGCDITEENKGAKYPPKNGVDRYKCKDCYNKEPLLKQECEVYSRVVGYLRPVKQWNLAKRLEYDERKEFKPEFKEK